MHPDAQVVLGGFQAFAQGDMAALKELMADDAVWHAGARNKWSGDRVGQDSIMELMAGINADATVDNELHAVLADDDHVVVLVNSSVSRDSKSFSGNTVFVFHVEDGKVQEAWSVPVDPYGLDAFWED